MSNIKAYATYCTSTKRATPVDISTFRAIANAFNIYIRDMVKAGHRVQLSNLAGVFEVLGRKLKPKIVDGQIKGLPPDWVSTKKYWSSKINLVIGHSELKGLRDQYYKQNLAQGFSEVEAKLKVDQEFPIIYCNNSHTDNTIYKIVWRGCKVKYSSLYSFVACRNFKRLLHTSIIGGKEYRIT